MRVQNYLPASKVWDVVLSVLNSWRRIGYLPNVWKPTTFNELILSHKVSFPGDLSLAKTCTDKIESKNYLRQNGFERLLVPTIASLSTRTEIREFVYSGPCVVKAAHSSGAVLIKSEIGRSTFSDLEVELLVSWLEEDYYLRGREINYDGLLRRIIVEELLHSPDGGDLRDYKVFCCHGVPFMIQVDFDRWSVHTRQFYTTNWHLLKFSCAYPIKEGPIAAPAELADLLFFSEKLSRPFGFVRIDFYIAADGIKFGEFTFFPGNGSERFQPISGDLEAGQLAFSVKRLQS